MERKTARISKEPEVRRQEILDTAIWISADNGNLLINENRV